MSKLRNVILVLVLHMFLLSCSKARLEGVVLDPWGKPISAVTVQLERSAFKTNTGSDGRYSLEYATGRFNVRFSKQGYTTEVVELDLQERRSFPVEQITLFPVPESGMFVVGESKLIELIPSRITDGPDRLCIPSSEEAVPDIRPGKVKFIDRIDRPKALYPMSRNRQILVDYSRGDIKGNSILTKDALVGEEKLLVREAELAEGEEYAWVLLDGREGIFLQMLTGGKCFLLYVPENTDAG